MLLPLLRAEQYAALASQRRDSIAVHAAVCAQFQTVHWLSAVRCSQALQPGMP
jgi:hypothetical protein